METKEVPQSLIELLKDYNEYIKQKDYKIIKDLREYIESCPLDFIVSKIGNVLDVLDIKIVKNNPIIGYSPFAFASGTTVFFSAFLPFIAGHYVNKKGHSFHSASTALTEVFIHELYHILLNHTRYSMEGINPEVMNIALDIIIWNHVYPIFGKEPANCKAALRDIFDVYGIDIKFILDSDAPDTDKHASLYDEYNGDDISIYHKLMKDNPTNNAKTNRGSTMERGRIGQDVGDDNGNTCPYKDEVIDAIKKFHDEVSSNMGRVGHGSHERKVSPRYQTSLDKFLTMVRKRGHHNRSNTVNNRKLYLHPLVFHKRFTQKPDGLVVIVDTSGSMHAYEDKILSAIEYTIIKNRIKDGVYLTCDTEVISVDFNDVISGKYSISSGGGSVFTDVSNNKELKDYMKNKNKVVVLFFSDLYIDPFDPDEAGIKNMLVVYTDEVCRLQFEKNYPEWSKFNFCHIDNLLP